MPCRDSMKFWGRGRLFPYGIKKSSSPSPVVVTRCINLIEDYLNFSTVCKSWHSLATNDNFNSNLPRFTWLMLAEEDDEKTCRRFFCLYYGMILKKRIPEARGKRCMKSMGWHFTIRKDEGEINLLHCISGVQIQLPHQNTTKHYRPRTMDLN
ncbi:hypothetical protein H5410_043875, partial [Solanum commersonii]